MFTMQLSFINPSIHTSFLFIRILHELNLISMESKYFFSWSLYWSVACCNWCSWKCHAKHTQCPENATEPDDVNADPFDCAAAAARRNLVIENFDSSRVKYARYGNCFTFEKVCSDVYRRYMFMYKYCVRVNLFLNGTQCFFYRNMSSHWLSEENFSVLNITLPIPYKCTPGRKRTNNILLCMYGVIINCRYQCLHGPKYRNLCVRQVDCKCVK